MNIIGTITKVKNYITNQEVSVKINNDNQLEVFKLQENRVYTIPYFQREIRWKKENLLELIGDVNNAKKFLGNIILTKVDNNTYEIIDGQQRTTMILMIVQYLKSKYELRFEINETCFFKVKSFDGFNILLSNNFEINDQVMLENIINTDEYSQYEKYNDLWNALKCSDILNNCKSAKTFYTNLKESEVNIVLNTGDYDEAIDYFIDVNVKGVQLDTEDIFKAHLFANDQNDEIRRIWSNLKNNVEKLKKQKVNYPLMKVIEHYFRCDLGNHTNYSNINFSDEFTLKNNTMVEGTEYCIGQHLITVINDNQYMKDSLKVILKYLELLNDVVCNGYRSEKFKIFMEDFEFNVDDDQRKLTHILINNLVRDDNIVPKVLVMKYYINIQLYKHKSKLDLKKINSVYVLTEFFNLFESKKSSEGLYKVVKAENWYQAIVKYINSYFDDTELDSRKVVVQYKYITRNKIENESQEFKCRSLAAIYNYFKITSTDVTIRKGKNKELIEFFGNKELFSLEHFILNHSGKYECGKDEDKKVYTYNEEVKKYINSLFNYIFIPRELNNKLGDKFISEKLACLESNHDEIKCQYSQLIIKKANDIFDFPISYELDNLENIDSVVTTYLYTKFKSKYLEFAKVIIDKITERCIE